jgi:hypothetical protein
MRIAFLGKPAFVAFSTTSASGTWPVAEVLHGWVRRRHPSGIVLGSRFDFDFFDSFPAHIFLSCFFVLESARERRSGLCGGDSCMVWALQPEGFWRLGGPFLFFSFSGREGRVVCLRAFSTTDGGAAWSFGQEIWGCICARFATRGPFLFYF